MELERCSCHQRQSNDRKWLLSYAVDHEKGARADEVTLAFVPYQRTNEFNLAFPQNDILSNVS
jgi:hypothetical protein